MISSLIPTYLMASPFPGTVFISYSRDDRPWVDRLLKFLTPFIDQGALSVWEDSEIEAGEEWLLEIQDALDRASVGLLLVSASFLASSFVRQVELPALVAAAEDGRLELLWVPVSASAWKRTPLERYAAVLDADEPLEVLRGENRKRALLHIAERVARAADCSLTSGFAADGRVKKSLAATETTHSDVRQGRLHEVPALPLHYRPRADDLDRLRLALLDGSSGMASVGNAPSRVGLHGEGGIGKSVLAAALARDEQVRRAFPDGIFWVTLGQDPDLDHIQATLLGDAATEPATAAPTRKIGRKRLSECFRDSAALVVLDDVWDYRHARAFDVLGPGSRLLVTTRDAAVLTALGAEKETVERLPQSAALALMASWAGVDAASLPADAYQVVRTCGCLPLAVALAGANVRDGMRWREIRRGLERGRLEVLDHAYSSVSRSMQLSVDALAPPDRLSYLQLKVFRKDEPVPAAVLLGLWQRTSGLDEIDGRRLLARLQRKALLEIRGPESRQTISLHDLQHDFIRATDGDVFALHEAVLAALAARLPEDAGGFEWWRLPLGDRYAWNHVAAHLAGASRSDALRRLLFDCRWLESKLRAVGPPAVLTDFQVHPKDQDLALVAGALRLSAHVLAADSGQLRSQLLGRLLGVDRPQIREMLDEAVATAQGTWLRPAVASLSSPAGALLCSLPGHAEPVTAVAVTPDGRRIVSASSDGIVKVWTVDTYLQEWHFAGGEGAIAAVVTTPCSRFAISGSANGILKVWDLLAGEEAYTLDGNGGSLLQLAMAPEGQHLVSTAGDGMLRVWDLAGKRLKWILAGGAHRVRSAAVAADGRAVSAADDGTLTVWNLEAGKEERTLPGRGHGVTTLAISLEGRRIVVGGSDGTLQVWDLETGAEGRPFPGHAERITALAVTPDGDRAISASSDHTVRVWNLETRVEERRLAGHARGVLGVVITSDGRRVVSSSADRTLKVWDLEVAAQDRLPTERDGVRSVAVTPNGQFVLAAPSDGSLKVWELETVTQTGVLLGHSRRVLTVGVTLDGNYAVSGSIDGTLKIWDLATGKERSLPGHTGEIWSVAFTPDGRRIISASADHTLKVWNVATLTEERALIGHADGVTAVAVSPDGSFVVSSSKDQTIKVWDLATGAVLRTLSDHSDWVTSVTVTPDGRCAVSGSDDCTVRVWNLETGMLERTLQGHTRWVNAVVVTSDGRIAASASEDTTLRVWNLETGNLLTTYSAESTLHSCAITPDNSWLIAGDRLGRVHFLVLENPFVGL